MFGKVEERNLIFDNYILSVSETKHLFCASLEIIHLKTMHLSLGIPLVYNNNI